MKRLKLMVGLLYVRVPSVVLCKLIPQFPKRFHFFCVDYGLDGMSYHMLLLQKALLPSGIYFLKFRLFCWEGWTLYLKVRWQ